jgi:hypothetical protein
MVTGSLGHLPYAELLNTAAALGISGVEFNARNWTSAPHFNLHALAKDGASRKSLPTDLKARNL